MGNPLIIGNPELGIKPNQRAMHEALSDVIDTYDKKNKNLLLPDLPDESITPEVENALFMQGEDTQPKPGENHKQHMQVHAGFAQSPEGRALPKDYKALLIQHITSTQQLAYIEEQEKKKLQGQGGVSNDQR